ncbi:MAG: NUDIX hydrolase [Proteobacteria bacterium]|jgi:mutator protein MutT|nr:NUDIX hydrolase [Pseudomonadota bacterium]
MTNPETVLCVGAVVVNEDKILLVRQSKGHQLEGQWTTPWGRVEDGESPMNAAIREVKEEGGIEVSVTGLLGVLELPPPELGWVSLVYLCKHLSGYPSLQETETDAARYFSIEEYESLNEPKEPWSEWLIRKVYSGNFTATMNDPTNPLQHDGTFL